VPEGVRAARLAVRLARRYTHQLASKGIVNNPYLGGTRPGPAFTPRPTRADVLFRHDRDDARLRA
jgi:hypothetical protein